MELGTRFDLKSSFVGKVDNLQRRLLAAFSYLYFWSDINF